jgi:Do/DeqQ family serine protease
MGFKRAIASILALVGAAGAASANDPFLRRTTTVQVVEETGPAVVSILTEQLVQRAFPSGNPFFDQFFRNFSEPRMPSTATNLGSGVLIDAERRVLTNAHVVAKASRIQVSLADGREFEAELVGLDPNNDLAVLRVKTSEKLPWIPPGRSADLMVGEPVIAIGNPFGLSHTVTTGVISALNRSIVTEDRTYHGFLQTDASINPGNSGGPLINAHGKLVAINTAVYNPATSQGIGFAIPIDTARRVVRELIDHGEVSPVWLGIEFQDLTPALKGALQLPERVGGALVSRVRPDSPGGRAGLRRGDVVTHMDGQAIDSARSFFERLETSTDGQRIALDVQRGGKSLEVPVTATEIPRRVIDEVMADLTGLSLVAAGSGGFEVTEVRRGSGAARIGVQPGDLLLAINGRSLVDADALRRAVLDLRGYNQAQVVVQRGGSRYHVALPLL